MTFALVGFRSHITRFIHRTERNETFHERNGSGIPTRRVYSRGRRKNPRSHLQTRWRKFVEIFNYAVIAESFEIIQKNLNYAFIRQSNVPYIAQNISKNLKFKFKSTISRKIVQYRG